MDEVELVLLVVEVLEPAGLRAGSTIALTSPERGDAERLPDPSGRRRSPRVVDRAVRRSPCGYRRRPWSSASTTASASSPARPPASGSRPRGCSPRRARVVVSGREPDRVESARAEVGAALGVAGDLSPAEAPGELIARAEAELGQVDCPRQQRRHRRSGGLRRAQRRRLGGHVAAERHELRARDPGRCCPGCASRGSGRIVNVSSTAGKRPSTSMPNYSVTKAAVLSLSRLVADLYAGDGILCNAVTPGPTASPAWLAPGGLADQAAERSGKSRRRSSPASPQDARSAAWPSRRRSRP